MKNVTARATSLCIALMLSLGVVACGSASKGSEVQEEKTEAVSAITTSGAGYGIVGEEGGTAFSTNYLSVNVAPRWVCDASGSANEHIDDGECSGYQVVMRSPDEGLEHNHLYIYVYDGESYEGCDEPFAEQAGLVENVRELAPVTVGGAELAGQQFTHPATAGGKKQYESAMYRGVVNGHWVEVAVADSSDDGHIVGGADVASMIASIEIF